MAHLMHLLGFLFISVLVLVSSACLASFVRLIFCILFSLFVVGFVEEPLVENTHGRPSAITVVGGTKKIKRRKLSAQNSILSATFITTTGTRHI